MLSLSYHATLGNGFYTYICTHFRHTWQSTELTPCARQHCYIASQWLAERADFCKMLKDTSTVARTEQQTWKGLVLSTPLPEQMGYPCVSKHTLSRRAKFSFSPLFLTTSVEGRQVSSPSPQIFTEGSTAESWGHHVLSLVRCRQTGTLTAGPKQG